MRSALRSVPGVEEATVDFAGKTATVTCKGKCDTAAMVAVLEQAGFGGSLSK